MRSTQFLLAIILVFSSVNLAWSGIWVESPTSVPGTAGTFEAGGNCCAWVKNSGDHFLFFDVWSGAWTELTLPETHSLVRVEGKGNLILVVCEDLAVVFHGPNQSVHQMPLSGTLLDTGYTTPSFACAEELAVVVTDDKFYVFDARLDQWRSLNYDFPIDLLTFHGVVAESDYVAADMSRFYPSPNINLAYSSHTRTFLQTYEGVGGLTNGGALDHGFAGLYHAGPVIKAKGWSAFTCQMTAGIEISDNLIGWYPVNRERRDLCHLAGFNRLVTLEPYVVRHTMLVYDTITGDWHETSYVFDTRDAVSSSWVDMGGQCVSHCTVYLDDDRNIIRFYNGQTGSFELQNPLLYDFNLGRIMGGSVAAYGQDFDTTTSTVWWCRSVQHPAGQYTGSTRELSCCTMAGDEWFSVGQRTVGDPIMDLFFYHGPTNHMTQVQTWTSTVTPVAGAHVNCLVTSGDDVEVNFYSGVMDVVAQRSFPSGTWTSQSVNDYLALAYNNNVGDYLFDARTGTVHSRGVDFTANSLGTEVVVGFDPASYVAHAFSAPLAQWYTQSLGENGYGRGGGMVGFCRTSNGSRYWGFNALDGTWTELETTGLLPSQDHGDNTIVVSTSDRVWAFWPYNTVGVEDEEEQRVAALAQAVSAAKCFPNPFNGRALVEFRLPVAADVRIEVFDLRGQRVATLLNEPRQPGLVSAVWKTDQTASGSYLVRLEAAGVVETRKLSLVQ